MVIKMYGVHNKVVLFKLDFGESTSMLQKSHSVPLPNFNVASTHWL